MSMLMITAAVKISLFDVSAVINDSMDEVCTEGISEGGIRTLHATGMSRVL